MPKFFKMYQPCPHISQTLHCTLCIVAMQCAVSSAVLCGVECSYTGQCPAQCDFLTIDLDSNQLTFSRAAYSNVCDHPTRVSRSPKSKKPQVSPTQASATVFLYVHHIQPSKLLSDHINCVFLQYLIFQYIQQIPVSQIKCLSCHQQGVNIFCCCS